MISRFASWNDVVGFPRLADTTTPDQEPPSAPSDTLVTLDTNNLTTPFRLGENDTMIAGVVAQRSVLVPIQALYQPIDDLHQHVADPHKQSSALTDNP